MPKILVCLCGLLWSTLPLALWAQLGGLLGGGGAGALGNLTNLGGNFSNLGSGSADSLAERDFDAEQIRLSYHRLFEQKFFPIDDSSFNPRREEFFIPYGKHPLGNYGNALYSYVFDLDQHYRPGPNLHLSPYAFYRLSKAQIRLYDAIRPFGSLGYLIGSMQQQMLSGSYTQNVTNHLNIFFDYQFSNSPGYFKNQTANNSKLVLGFQYRAYQQRYLLTAFVIRNNVVSNENNGVISDDIIKNPSQPAYLEDRTTVPVRLGDNIGYSTNPFNLTLYKGRREKGMFAYLQNTYRLGRVDSFWSQDSIRVFVFKPKMSASHILEYETLEHSFVDNSATSDQDYYQTYLPSIPLDTTGNRLRISDKWRIIRNQLQLRYFPKLGSQEIFWHAQLGFEALAGSTLFNQDSLPQQLFNLYLSGKLQSPIPKAKLKLTAFATYYLAGLNWNDLQLGVSAEKSLGEWGTLRGLARVLRTRPMSFQRSYSAFNRYAMEQDEFNALQIWNLSLNWELPKYNLGLQFKWTRLKNYVYQENYDKLKQYQPFLDIAQLELRHLLSLPHGFKLLTQLTLQPSIFNPYLFRVRSFAPPLELPLLHSLHKFYFQHNFLGYLQLLLGLELRWNSPYYAPMYNPVYAKLVQQKTQVLYNLPQLHLFLKTRIRKKFSLSLRLENLNSLRVFDGTFGPTNNNFVLPNYPLYSMIVQGGVVWDFVN